MNFNQLVKYNIRIRHTANGAIILKIGCAEFAYTSPKDMLLQLAEFYSDPEKVEKEYNDFMQHTVPQPVDDAPDRGYGNTLARGPAPSAMEVESSEREVSQPEEVAHEAEEQTDDEVAPRLVAHRFNLVDSDDVDSSDVSDPSEEIVELELGDLEDLIESESESESGLAEIEFDLEEEINPDNKE